MKSIIIVGVSMVYLLFTGFQLESNIDDSLFKIDLGHENEKVTQGYKYWHITELADSLSKLGSNQFAFMNEQSMKGSYIEIQEGEAYQSKANKDQLFYLYAGSCSIFLSGVERSFNKGDVVFVKKGSDFFIESSKEKLQMVSVSMNLDSNSKTLDSNHFSKSSIETYKSAYDNTWNPFIMYSNVMFGMYMLPRSIDGDGRLVHEWQELNIVTSGSSKFVMDTDSISVKEGSIFFVEEGNGHYFDNLNEDINILILWEQRNISHEGH